MSTKTEELPDAKEIEENWDEVAVENEAQETVSQDAAMNGDDKINGEEKINGEVKSQPKSGVFKVKVSGLPRFYPLGVSKSMLKTYVEN